MKSAVRCLALLTLILAAATPTWAMAPRDDNDAVRKKILHETEQRIAEERAALLRELQTKIQKPAPAQAKAGGAYLGIKAEPLGEDIASVLGLKAGEGLLITEVVADSPAAKAGLLANDILLKHDGKKIASLESFVEWIRSCAPGEEHTFDLMRKMQEKTVRVTLGGTGSPTPAPGGDDEALRKRIIEEAMSRFDKEREALLRDIEAMLDKELGAKSGGKPSLGLRLDDLDAGTCAILGLEPGTALKVTLVDEGGSADRAGIQAPDIVIEVDGNTVRGLEGFKKIYAGWQAGETHTFTVLRKLKTLSFDVTLDKAGAAPSPTTDRSDRGQALEGKAFEASVSFSWKELNALATKVTDAWSKLDAQQRQPALEAIRNDLQYEGPDKDLMENLLEATSILANIDANGLRGFLAANARRNEKGRLTYTGEDMEGGMTAKEIQRTLNFIFTVNDKNEIAVKSNYRMWARMVAETLQQFAMPEDEGAKKVLGVYIGELTEAEHEKLKGGVKLIDIVPGSVAERAGMRKGDIIRTWGADKQEVKNQNHLRRLIQESETDVNIPVRVLGEDGKERDLHLKFDKDGTSATPPADLASAPRPAAPACEDAGDDLAALADEVRRKLAPQGEEIHAAPAPAPDPETERTREQARRLAMEQQALTEMLAELKGQDDDSDDLLELEELVRSLRSRLGQDAPAPTPESAPRRRLRMTDRPGDAPRPIPMNDEQDDAKGRELELILKMDGETIVQARVNLRALRQLKKMMPGLHGDWDREVAPLFLHELQSGNLDELIRRFQDKGGDQAYPERFKNIQKHFEEHRPELEGPLRDALRQYRYLLDEKENDADPLRARLRDLQDQLQDLKSRLNDLKQR